MFKELPQCTHQSATEIRGIFLDSPFYDEHISTGVLRDWALHQADHPAALDPQHYPWLKATIQSSPTSSMWRGPHAVPQDTAKHSINLEASEKWLWCSHVWIE